MNSERSYKQFIGRGRWTYRDMGISGIPLGIGGGEDCVDEHEGPDDLSPHTDSGGVAVGEDVGSAAVLFVVRLLEGFDEPDSADSTQALGDHVHDGSNQGNLPGKE